MDQEISHICLHLGITPALQKKMVEFGVCTAQSLMAAEEEIKRKELFHDMKATDEDKDAARKKLLLAIKWREKNPDADIQNEFSDEVYLDLNELHTHANDYIFDLGQPYEKKNFYQDVEDDNELLTAVIQKCKEQIMESDYLRNECGKFDYDSFIDKAIRHFHALVNLESDARLEMDKLFIVAGRTQAGKSAVKGVIQSMCGLLRIPLIILTKGVGESIGLHAKLVALSDGTLMERKHVVVASNKADGCGTKVKNERIRVAFEGHSHGGTLVIADTKAQVMKACRAIEGYRKQLPGGQFVLIIDEADDLFRTTDRHQVFERALSQLQAMNPSMTMMISATPVSFMIPLILDDHLSEDIEFFNLIPQESYVGLEDIVPLQVKGKDLFLDQNELNNRSVYVSAGVKVEYANDKLISLYDDGLSHLDSRKGVLILDCSCPRVYVRGNLTEKAESVQKLYQLQGIDVSVLTISGRGISVKFPCKKWDSVSWSASLISDALEYIDDTYGLSMPVIIFGYTKMCRGTSFRSSRRVPTHMVLAMGRGHNASNVVQTLGRATFNGRNVLNENGFNKVTVLMTSNDLTMCVKIQNYVNHIADRMQQGDSLAAAMTGTNEEIPDTANWIRHTFRELGRVKGFKEIFKEVVQFCDCDMRYELTPDDKETKEKFWYDTNAQILLRSLARLRKGNEQVCKEDIVDDLVDTGGGQLQKKTLDLLLQKFCDKSLISKVKVNREEGLWYRVPKVERMNPFMNPDMGELPDTEEDEDVDDEDEDEAEAEDDCDSSLSSSGSEIKSSAVLFKENAVIRAKAKTPSADSQPVPISMDSKQPPQWKVHSPRKTVSSQKIGKHPAASSEPLTDVDNVPKGTDSVRGTIIVEPEKKRRIYFTDHGDTPCKIAARFEVDVNQIIRDNRRRKNYEKISKHGGFEINSPIVLPMKRNNDCNSFLGSREDPIEILESSDEISVSSISMSFGSNNEKKKPWPRKAMRSSRKGKPKKESKIVSPEKGEDLSVLTDGEPLTNVEDVPKGTDSVRGTIIVEPKKKRRIYYTDKGDTPCKIAKKFEVGVDQIIRDNKRREKYEKISKYGGFEINSPIVLPM